MRLQHGARVGRYEITGVFYLAANRDLTAVPYRATATTFEPGAAKALFPIPGSVIRRSYSPSVDGRRFLVGKAVDENTSDPVRVVLNRQAGLQKK
jgi:hypothetical protein